MLPLRAAGYAAYFLRDFVGYLYICSFKMLCELGWGGEGREGKEEERNGSSCCRKTEASALLSNAS